MKPPIQDGVVLLTGASAGIGMEMARQLAAKARVLALVARREALLNQLADELRAQRPELVVMVLPCDLCDPVATAAMVQELVAAHGWPDVLINNAGFGDIGFFEAAEWPKLQRMVQLNVVALMQLTHLVLPAMVERGRGGVLNVSSGFGLTWMPVLSTYVASKYFVSAFTEGLRLELASAGVVVSQLCPGPVKTGFEEVAGNEFGLYAPDWFQLDAPTCARLGLQAFERGAALCVPGFWAKVSVTAGRLSPSWVLRLVYGAAMPFSRRRLGLS